MRNIPLFGVMLFGLALPARADDVPERYQPAVKKGLEWLAKQQHTDGHWSAQGDQYPTAMTAFAGMALLAEGSTAGKGKYAEPIRRAVAFMVERSQQSGLIGDPNAPGDASRYIFGHGFGMAFLSAALPDLPADQRKKVKDILNRAVQFSVAAQTMRGGWGYVSAKDGSNFDEGACTIATLQGLHAARAAGIPVPRDLLKKSYEYFSKSTTARGGVIYSLSTGGGAGAAVGQERPALTAGTLAVNADGGDAELAGKWHKLCREQLPVPGAGRRLGFDEYTIYYYGQGIYALGDTGWAKLFPQDKQENQLTWSRYRTALFDELHKTQGADGSWGGNYMGPVFATSLYLTVMQLDKDALPIPRR